MPSRAGRRGATNGARCASHRSAESYSEAGTSDAVPGSERKGSMLARKLPVLVLALGLAVAVVVSGASARTSAGGSGILRIGTTTYIDSFNPFNYIESQAFNAFVMVYPQLVQYTYGEQGFAIEGDWARSW